MFQATDYETAMIQEINAPNPVSLKEPWRQHVLTVFEQAKLPYPSDKWMHQGGKDGRHTEHLGYILADMQYLQRTYPGATW
jgi:ring-1,2-phenylacetyl-CoA epoxidase subunit PaaC